MKRSLATMAQNIPLTMRSLAITKHTRPSGYQVLELPVPTIEAPDDVLIRVHAAAIMTGDTQYARGGGKLLGMPTEFPFKLGMEGAGVVVAIGSGVKSLRVGDAVYGLYFKHGNFPLPRPGFVSDYTVVPADILLLKPPHLSFEQAAALAGTICTQYQCLKRYFALANEPLDGATLEGKTVFVPGALSATGSMAVQIVKNIFGASRVISTVSTPKMGLVEQHLPGLVDQLVDYKTQDVVSVVGKGTVDFVFNTQWDMVRTGFPLANPETGIVVSLASWPSAAIARSMFGAANVPFYVIWFATLAHWYYAWKLRGTNIKVEFVSGNPGKREDLEKAGEWVASGKLTPVMTVVSLDDIQAVRRASEMVAAGKGGLGKLVIKIV
ncbi:chaperonin 10-like protein [Bombardia bombarda]|uniref:Chaperonin 10-like protein n=1 Tax=Bombardia bombarda TaxID=252184 RepID=A0AA39WGD9_9PEZI|nr:chaperonin 10-like protein [Bombardia bombarda]